MRDVFEKVAKAYEGAKESVRNKWENFKKKFGETKNEMSQEVMKAETPEDLIDLGKKLQQQGEALKAEKGGIEQEETEKGKLEAEKGKIYESDRDEALEEDAARDKEKMDKAHGEAIEEDKAFDEAKAAKAAEEEAKRKAEIAELDRVQAEEDAEKAAEILKKIKGENVEEVPIEKSENADQIKETPQENLIEQIGAPKNDMFEKYGSKMRQAADELVSNREKIIANEEKLKKVEHGSEEWKKLWNENKVLIDQRDELRSDAAFGSKVIKFEAQGRESWSKYSDYKSKEMEEYKKTAMDDPHVVLRMLEAGMLGKDEMREVSDRLMGNSEFVSEAIKSAKKSKAGPFSGWFYNSVTGEARANKDLFEEAVKLNPLNYQFGSNEFKSDQEIQKTALKSGLDPVYLYKG